jgi:hypothetical protein
MANEKQTSINFSVTKSNLRVGDVLAISENLSGSDYYAKAWTVTTSWVAIPLDALASFDLLMVKNTDATNFVSIATANDGTHKFAKLTAGRAMFIPPDSASTLYWKADTASCVCNVTAVEP